MPILNCSACGSRLRVPETSGGKKVACPNCKAVITVAASEEPPPLPIRTESAVEPPPLPTRTEPAGEPPPLPIAGCPPVGELPPPLPANASTTSRPWAAPSSVVVYIGIGMLATVLVVGFIAYRLGRSNDSVPGRLPAAAPVRDPYKQPCMFCFGSGVYKGEYCIRCEGSGYEPALEVARRMFHEKAKLYGPQQALRMVRADMGGNPWIAKQIAAEEPELQKSLYTGNSGTTFKFNESPGPSPLADNPMLNGVTPVSPPTRSTPPVTPTKPKTPMFDSSGTPKTGVTPKPAPKKVEKPIPETEVPDPAPSVSKPAPDPAPSVSKPAPDPGSDGPPKNPTLDAVTVDLLKLVRPDKHSVHGKWQMRDGVLVSPSDQYARMSVPYAPPAEYTLRLTVTRKQGHDAFVVGLVAGDSGTALLLDLDYRGGRLSGFDQVDQVGPESNGSGYTGALFKNDKAGEVVCTVRTNVITVVVDGKPIIEFKVGSRRLSVWRRWAMPDKQCLFVGSQSSVYRITKMEITAVSGQGRAVP